MLATWSQNFSLLSQFLRILERFEGRKISHFWAFFQFFGFFHDSSASNPKSALINFVKLNVSYAWKKNQPLISIWKEFTLSDKFFQYSSFAIRILEYSFAVGFCSFWPNFFKIGSDGLWHSFCWYQKQKFQNFDF